jgi:hypothetical protein
VSKYITITQSGFSPSGKTKVFRVDSKEAGFEIGYVRFYPKWRKYVYEPLNNTIYEQVCLRDIASFIEEQTVLWRGGAKEVRQA